MAEETAEATGEGAAAPEAAPEAAAPASQVDELVKTNLHGVAKVKLGKLPVSTQRALHDRLSEKLDTPPAPCTDAELVEAILKLKKRVAEMPRPPPMPAPDRWRALAKGLNKQAAAIAYCYTETQELPAAVYEPKQLRVCTFNAMKLRLIEPQKRLDGEEGVAEDGAILLRHWSALAHVMANCDVIVMQEVPAAEKKRDERVLAFLQLLSQGTETGRSWSYVPSLASGKGGMSATVREVHVAFVKSPLTIEGVDTWERAGFDASVVLDYSPLQIVVADPRYSDPPRRSLITSVHLPPESRYRERDMQLRALFSGYWPRARARWGMLQTEKGAKDAKKKAEREHHLIAGDYNTYPAKLEKENEVYGISAAGFIPTVPESASTSVGLKNYDNVVVDAHTHQRYFPSSSVLKLVMPQNSAKGVIGLSDHYPIVFTLQYAE